MEPVIVFDKVNFAYNADLIALQNSSFTIKAGEFLAVIGPNGGGKTTILKLIMGLLTPTAGEIKILGKSPRLVRNEIGYVPQFSTFNRDFPISVANTVLLGRLGSAKNFFGYSKEDKEIAHDFLVKLNIEHLAKRPIGSLSGGQLQRVLVARALASKPKLLLLDEPTANVDIHAEQSIFDLLSFLNHEVTIVLVSHDIGFVAQYIDRVLCVNKSVFCHNTAALTPELIEKLYGIKVHVVDHGHKSGENNQ